MWQIIISAFSPFVAAGLAATAYIWQVRRNARLQVYLEAVPSLYGAQRLVALWTRGQVEKECLSKEKREELSEAFKSLLGPVGKLHLAASEKTMNAVNDFYSALSEVYEGLVPADDIFRPPAGAPVFRDIRATDVPTQLRRFDDALIRLLSSMLRILMIVNTDSYQV